MDRIHRGSINLTSEFFINNVTGFHQNLIPHFHICHHITTPDTIGQLFTHFFRLGNGKHLTNSIATIIFEHYHILRHIHETASQITGVRSTKSGIGQTFTSTVRRNKVFDHIKTFFETTLHRQFDNITGRRYYETFHTHHLTELAKRTTSTGINHGEHGTIFVESALTFGHDAIFDLSPNFQNLGMAFALRKQTLLILLFGLMHEHVTLFQNFRFTLNLGEHTGADGIAGLGNIFEAQIFERIGKKCGILLAVNFQMQTDNLR